MTENRSLKCEYDVYNRRKYIAYLIVGIIIISTMGITQTVLASDSIVEIRFASDFYIDNSTVITEFRGGNTTINHINGSIDTNLNLFMADNSNPLTHVNYEDRIRFWIKPLVFSGLIAIVQTKGLFGKNLGILKGNMSILAPNTIFKVRVPRDLTLFTFTITFAHLPNLANNATNVDDFLYTIQFIGVPMGNHTQLTTSYDKMVITIHSINYNQTIVDTMKAIQANSSIYKPSQIINPQYSPSVNLTVSHEVNFDIFNPNIK